MALCKNPIFFIAKLTTQGSRSKTLFCLLTSILVRSALYWSFFPYFIIDGTVNQYVKYDYRSVSRLAIVFVLNLKVNSCICSPIQWLKNFKHFMQVDMFAAKKRKIDDEGRLFNKEWSDKYFVVQHNHGAVCVICQTTIAVMKEYNIKRHYTTKRSTIYDAVVGQDRVNKLEEMIKSLTKQQAVFTGYKKDSELVTKLSFKICELIAQNGKSFSDGEFIKDCLDIFADFVCP